MAVSLGIAFKGPEGIVLAADSRVTLMAVQQAVAIGPNQTQNLLFPATFDNATKLLKVKGQDFVGAVTYGTGAIGMTQPRTASSYLPEFEAELGNEPRLHVEEFARRLGNFFLGQWRKSGMPEPAPPTGEMVFLVGGYDPDAPYGRIFIVTVPNHPTPLEQVPEGEFGAAWGGQRELTDRILQGFDPQLPVMAYDFFKTPAQDRTPALEQHLKGKLTLPIPWQFLPLQDCVDLSIFLVRATIGLQKWMVAIRGVGGAVDVATITRTDGFKIVQQKTISGEKIA